MPLTPKGQQRKPRTAQNILDTRALEIAMEAKQIILDHRETCSRDRLDRQDQMRDVVKGLAEVKQEVARIINRGMLYLIGILIPVVGYLLAHYVVTGK